MQYYNDYINAARKIGRTNFKYDMRGFKVKIQRIGKTQKGGENDTFLAANGKGSNQCGVKEPDSGSGIWGLLTPVSGNQIKLFRSPDPNAIFLRAY
jgi:hypothetical protein